jgi:integrase
VTRGLPLGDQKATLDEFLSRWLANSVTVRSPNTRANLKWAVGHIVGGLGGRRLRDLSADDVEAFLRAEAAAGLSRSSLVRIHSTLKRALRHAERVGKVARNVAALVDTPDGPTSEARSLTVDEARRLLDAARGDRFEALYIAGLMIGPRPGELLGLTWADVDLDRAVIYIVRALTRAPDGRLALSQPKTPRSRRTVDLPAPLVATLRAHKARQATERLAAGKTWQDHGARIHHHGRHAGRPVEPAARVLRADEEGGAWTLAPARVAPLGGLDPVGRRCPARGNRGRARACRTPDNRDGLPPPHHTVCPCAPHGSRWSGCSAHREELGTLAPRAG